MQHDVACSRGSGFGSRSRNSACLNAAAWLSYDAGPSSLATSMHDRARVKARIGTRNKEDDGSLGGGWLAVPAQAGVRLTLQPLASDQWAAS